jgi:hypothetical protein
MAKVKITGHASGTGILTVTAPNTSTDRTITLPDATGTLAITTDDDDKLPLAGGTMTGGLDLNDSVKARWGTGNDLEIFHDGSNSYIKDVGSGNLRIQGVNVGIGGTNDEYAIYCDTNGAVDLYHDNSSKLATTAAGVTVTGEVTTTTGKLTNTPSFSAYRASGEQSVSDGTWTKVEFPNEHWDSDSAFDTTNDKFIVPSGEGGKYLFNYAARGESLDAGEHAMLRLYKNGSALDETRTNGYAAVDNQQVYIRGSAMLALAAADYIELWAYQNEGASRNLHNEYLHFSGMKLIGV